MTNKEILKQLEQIDKSLKELYSGLLVYYNVRSLNGGRPKISLNHKEIKELRKQGLSYRKIAKRYNISHVTIYRRINNG